MHTTANVRLVSSGVCTLHDPLRRKLPTNTTSRVRSDGRRQHHYLRGLELRSLRTTTRRACVPMRTFLSSIFARMCCRTSWACSSTDQACAAVWLRYFCWAWCFLMPACHGAGSCCRAGTSVLASMIEAARASTDNQPNPMRNASKEQLGAPHEHWPTWRSDVLRACKGSAVKP